MSVSKNQFFTLEIFIFEGAIAQNLLIMWSLVAAHDQLNDRMGTPGLCCLSL
jgi:hypothetical protein